VGGSNPFVVRLKRESAAPGIFTFSYPLRYAALPLAQHIIGYCGGDGAGVAGMERAFDGWLQGGADVLLAECSTDALARAAGKAQLVRRQGSGNALQLTLDRILQRICEDVAADLLPRGAIVVLECRTGHIKASVSMPQYDPYNVQKSIEADDTALINRAFSSYNVGSVYKPLLAALALENGLDAEELYECTGSVEVDGHTYRCARRSGHGSIDLAGALQQSCNCYFIRLGQRLGGQTILEYSTLCGLGQATALGGGYTAGRGNLPTAAVLENSGELASLSFGQGKLTATPLQLAAAFNVFANGGVYVSPSLVEGLVNSNTGDVTESLYRPVQLRLLESSTASAMLELLEGVVTDGLGAAAAIPEAAVGGKTGTAQTGRALADDPGQELYDSWFVGFYPAQQPRYTIAVMADSTTQTGEDVAPVFAAVCRQLYYLQPQNLANSTNLGT
jgi:penicillin-binding protein 2